MASRADVSSSKSKPDITDITISILAGLALAIVAIFIASVPQSSLAGSRDFVIYWATGQQLVHHANPYDYNTMGPIERAAGLPAKYAVGMMRNLPYALPLALPLGFAGIKVAAFCWALFQLGCLTISIFLLWQLYGRPRDSLIGLAIIFAPALLCLDMGQTPIFALLGLTLFLRLLGTRPFLAGASLWLCALKPHLFIPFLAVLLVWIVFTKSYRLLAGAFAAMAASLALQFLIDPAAWSQYAQMMRISGIQDEPIPCLSIMLRLWTSPHSNWLQFLPAALGSAWALWYFWPRRHAWDWNRDGSLLMVVSVAVSPFCWLMDQTVLIPALMHGAYHTRSRILLLVFALLSLIIEIELSRRIGVFSIVYLWTAPAWLAWYLLARAFPRTEPDPALPRQENLDSAAVL